ncbi:ester cyclase [Niveibacterium sp. SC-1]|uniref:ester cyclase n=1 Tax=Niveibacterium sp. SC-1 TaxID=3135646 RepID=UPI00311F8F0B
MNTQLDEVQRNESAIRRLYEECINPGRLELLPELLDPEFTGGRGERGPEGFAESVRNLRKGFSDLSFTIEDLFGGRDRVAVRWTMRGRHTGPFAGVAASGVTVSQVGVVIYQMRDGRALQSALHPDRLGLYQQIGVIGPLETGFLVKPAADGAQAAARSAA